MPRAHTFPEPTTYAHAADNFELGNLKGAVARPRIFANKKYGWDDNLLERDVAWRVVRQEGEKVEYLESEVKRHAGVSEVAVEKVAEERKCKLYPLHTSESIYISSTNPRRTSAVFLTLVLTSTFPVLDEILTKLNNHAAGPLSHRTNLLEIRQTIHHHLYPRPPHEEPIGRKLHLFAIGEPIWQAGHQCLSPVHDDRVSLLIDAARENEGIKYTLENLDAGELALKRRQEHLRDI